MSALNGGVIGGSADARATLHFEPTGDINHIDQGNRSDPVDEQSALGVHLPLLVWGVWYLMWWLRQLGVLLVAASQSGLLEKGRYP